MCRDPFHCCCMASRRYCVRSRNREHESQWCWRIQNPPLFPTAKLRNHWFFKFDGTGAIHGGFRKIQNSDWVKSTNILSHHFQRRNADSTLEPVFSIVRLQRSDRFTYERTSMSRVVRVTRLQVVYLSPVRIHSRSAFTLFSIFSNKVNWCQAEYYRTNTHRSLRSSLQPPSSSLIHEHIVKLPRRNRSHHVSQRVAGNG